VVADRGKVPIGVSSARTTSFTENGASEAIRKIMTEEKVRCHLLHEERARQGLTICADCRRPLFPAPKSRCREHSVYCCPECFTAEQVDKVALERMTTGGRTP
jgi:hypothetical protein